MSMVSTISTVVTYGGPTILSGLIGLFFRHIRACASEERRTDVWNQVLENKNIVSSIVHFLSYKDRANFLYGTSKAHVLTLRDYIENSPLLASEIVQELHYFSKLRKLYNLAMTVVIRNLTDSHQVIALLKDSMYSDLLDLIKTLSLMTCEQVKTNDSEIESWETLLAFFRSEKKTTKFSLDFRHSAQAVIRSTQKICDFPQLEAIYFGRTIAMNLQVTNNPELKKIDLENIYGFIYLGNLPKLTSIGIKDLENIDTAKIDRPSTVSTILSIDNLERLETISIGIVNYGCYLELRSHFPSLTSFLCEKWVSFNRLDFTKCSKLEKVSIGSIQNSPNSEYPTSLSIKLPYSNNVCVHFGNIDSMVDIDFLDLNSNVSLPKALSYEESRVKNPLLLEKFKKWENEIKEKQINGVS